MHKSFISVPASIFLASILNWFNHNSYFETIRRTQTVDFNMLANTLPTKLSLALANNEKEEVQNTLNSNYGLFGLVVTDCPSSLRSCSDENIIAKSQPEMAGWKEKILPDKLSSNEYDLLLSLPPVNAERFFDNSRSDKSSSTQKVNSGNIIGRVYYIRRDPPSFYKSQEKWVKHIPDSVGILLTTGDFKKGWSELSSFFDSGANKYYFLTNLFGLFLGLSIGQRWNLSNEKKKILEQEIDQVNRENEKLNQKNNQLQIRLTIDKIASEESIKRTQDNVSRLRGIARQYLQDIDIKEYELKQTQLELAKERANLELVKQSSEKESINQAISHDIKQKISKILQRESELKEEVDKSRLSTIQYQDEIKSKEIEISQFQEKLIRTQSRLDQLVKQAKYFEEERKDNEKLRGDKQIDQSQIIHLQKKLKEAEQQTEDEIKRYAEEFDRENEKLSRANEILLRENIEGREQISSLEIQHKELEEDLKMLLQDSKTPKINLSSHKVAIVGGTSRSVKKTAEILFQLGLPKDKFVEVTTEEHSSDKLVKSKIENCTLVAVVTRKIGHDLSGIVKNLKNRQAINGDVIDLEYTAGATIADEIIKHVHKSSGLGTR
jgi:hypothetical protein